MALEQKDIGPRQYLSFSLREENYAINIEKVREVLDVVTLTKIPRLPDYLCGVISLRGSVVPVMDLGHRLGLPLIDRSTNTCIIIVEIEREGNSAQMGLLTDAVNMVIDLHSEDIEPVPKMGMSVNTEFIKGMGRQGDDKFLIILDIDRVLESSELIDLQGIGCGMPESKNDVHHPEQAQEIR